MKTRTRIVIEVTRSNPFKRNSQRNEKPELRAVAFEKRERNISLFLAVLTVYLQEQQEVTRTESSRGPMLVHTLQKGDIAIITS